MRTSSPLAALALLFLTASTQGDEKTDPGRLTVERIFAAREFLWLSERDGWQHVYRAGLDGKPVTLVTPGAFDVTRVLAVDPNGDWLYFQASPESTRLDTCAG
jgi:dipeptidyl-peptidase 4